MSDSTDEKTEEPTPKKLEDARNKGDVPQSKDFASFIIFLGLALAFWFTAPSFWEAIRNVMRDYFGLQSKLVSNSQEFVASLSDVVTRLAWIVGPIFLAVFIFGVASYLCQFGVLLTGEKLKPNFGKMNPISGFKRIFSRDTAVEFIKSSIKVITFGIILFFIVRSRTESMIEIGVSTVPMIFDYFIELMGLMIFAALVFIGVLGLADLAYQRWSYHTRMKMTLKEVRDEYKQREGDPHIKARIRQIQRDTARARMMDKVPTADVIVANPTHVAVAIKYKRGEMAAPEVVAKGAGFVAVRIKELGIKNGVPVLEKRDLARFLYKNIEIGQRIPESLYSAVAEVLAYVYRLKKKYRALGGIPQHALKPAEGGAS